MNDLIRMLGNSTFENYVALNFGYTEMAYQMSSHVLTLGFAVMLAGLLYFVLTIKTVKPKFRISSVLSVVVMVSAFLLLYVQQQNWTSSLVYDAETARYVLAPGADLFNNGYRYLNWLIDVPMLLFQILFVVTLTKSSFSSIRNGFWFSGAGMIITGYIGQFYEVTNPSLFFIWGFISTLFFIHILYLMSKVIKEGKEGIPETAQRYLGSIWKLFLFSWFLYPGAYLMPYLFSMGLEPALSETAVVARHITYTIADISSKVIYGILLTLVAQEMSKAEGYDYEHMEKAL
ncbi:bacteriorhodopsin [Gracilimonas mengyeensis]|uniref:Bacteriorhodopsin-like protein n=1 Tax=Gracilimonas mengyeensis TaxID=1302730 RepID=A0A521EPI2_9BACT|nr:bacteriorhodopsin [Gracilimonas mengyeensis]SMO85839.1 Bacteriorhodopsin-like protein [Gracilimonas mengyeensis]